MQGNGGRDILVLQVERGRDLIQDFEDGIDRLGLSENLAFEDLTIINSTANTATIIQDDNNNAIPILSGIDVNSITQADFVEM